MHRNRLHRRAELATCMRHLGTQLGAVHRPLRLPDSRGVRDTPTQHVHAQQ